MRRNMTGQASKQHMYKGRTQQTRHDHEIS